MKPFEVLRTGTHRDTLGNEHVFTAADLNDIATGFNAELSAAPIVIGHPKTDDPAYGWAKGFQVQGDRLLVDPEQVDAQFSTMVKDGRFKTRSVSLYTKDDPRNPTPGKYYARHIGFLGAAAPAVPGLKPVEFSAQDQAIEFTQPIERLDDVERILNGVSWMIGGLRKIFTDPKAAANFAQQFSDPPNPEQKETTMTGKTENAADFAQREADVKAKEDDLAKQQAEFAAQQALVRRTDDTAFIGGLVEAGKIPPGQKDGLIEFMQSLPADDTTIEFSQGEDGATIKKQPRAFFKDLLNSAKPVINFSEVSGDTNQGESGSDVTDAKTIAAKAAEFKAEQAGKGITVSTVDAVAHVKSQTAA